MKDQSNNYFKIVIGALALIFLTFVVYGAINVTQLTSIFTTTSNVNTTSETNFTHLTILANGSNAPYDNLVGYWSFDNDGNSTGGYTTAYDLSSNNNDGTYTSGANASEAGVYGNASQFDGSNSYIGVSTVGLMGGWNWTSNFTISAWAKSNGITGSGNTLVGYSSDGTHYNYFGQIAGTSKAHFDAYNGGGVVGCDGSVMTNGIWYHLVLVKNSSGITIYNNGAVDCSATSGGALADIGINIGTLGPSYTAYKWNGLIDEVMIFNSSLTAQQISDIYNNQSRRFYPTGTVETPAFNITYPNNYNQANISVNGFQRLFNTNISARIGYWNLTNGYNNTDLNTTANGLIGYWHLDNNSAIGDNSTRFVDSSGSGYNGSCSGNFCPNISGGFYHNGINGSGNKYITIPSYAAFSAYTF